MSLVGVCHGDTVAAKDACGDEGIRRGRIGRKLREILITVVRLFGGNEFVIEGMVFVSKGLRDLRMGDEVVGGQGHHAWVEGVNEACVWGGIERLGGGCRRHGRRRRKGRGGRRRRDPGGHLTHGQIGVIKGHVAPRVLKRSRAQSVPDVVVDVERFCIGFDADVGAVAVAVWAVIVVVGEVFAAGVEGIVRVFEVETKVGSDLTALQEESRRGEISRVFFDLTIM